MSASAAGLASAALVAARLRGLVPVLGLALVLVLVLLPGCGPPT
jgi:hypothetical protein